MENASKISKAQENMIEGKVKTKHLPRLRKKLDNKLPERRHKRKEQTFELSGRRKEWDDLRE